MGDHPALDPGRRPRHGRPGRRQAARGRVAARRTARGGRARGRPHRRPAAGDPVPAGARARLRGARRRHAAGRGRRRDRAGVLGRRGRSTAIDDTGVEFADRGGFETDDEEYGKLVEAIIRDEIGQGEGANLVIGRHYRATVADWGADKALTVLQAAARARARRLLDLRLLHRRPLPDRRQPGAARLDPRRRRPDEPDQRHLPDARASRAPTWPASCSTSCTTRRRSTSSSWSSTKSSR